jgi:hypothetical protein
MYKAAAALKGFFSGFGIPAYQEGTVPDDTQLPYITYSIASPEWNQKASMYAQVWDRTTSNAGIIRIADQITAAIGERKIIPLDGAGYLVIWPETPKVQIMVDGDYRNAYINLSVNGYHMPGV